MVGHSFDFLAIVAMHYELKYWQNNANVKGMFL